MAFVKLRIGTTSSSLFTIPEGLLNKDLAFDRQQQIKENTNFHGKPNITVVGQNKKNISVGYEHLSVTEYSTVVGYALSTRRWWVQIPNANEIGFIFSGFAYIRLDSDGVSQKTGLYYINIKIKEL